MSRRKAFILNTESAIEVVRGGITTAMSAPLEVWRSKHQWLAP
ncbi:hypothetical protein [Pseudomonas sp. dw_612]|nr:hypothetical protein [Pseudomonas sp. dw_612]